MINKIEKEEFVLYFPAARGMSRELAHQR